MNIRRLQVTILTLLEFRIYLPFGNFMVVSGVAGRVKRHKMPCDASQRYFLPLPIGEAGL